MFNFQIFKHHNSATCSALIKDHYMIIIRYDYTRLYIHFVGPLSETGANSEIDPPTLTSFHPAYTLLGTQVSTQQVSIVW